MQSTKRTHHWFRKASLGFSAVLMSHTASCDSGSLGTINTIVDGVQSVISQLDNRGDGHGNDISLGNLILDELN